MFNSNNSYVNEELKWDNVEKQIINEVSTIKMCTIHVCPFEEECPT